MPTQSSHGTWRWWVAAILLSMTSPALANLKLDIVTEAWPPLVEQRAGGPAGLLWETASGALACLGITAELDFVPWKRALTQVAQGEKEAILGIGYTSERSKTFQFPSEPLFNSETVAFHAAGRPGEIATVDSLAGLRVGVSAGYSYSAEIRNARQFERITVPDISSGLKMLRLGRVDVLLANRTVGESRLKALGLADVIVASESSLSGGPVYLAFSAQQPAGLVQVFSDTLATYKRTSQCPSSPSARALLH